MNQMNIIHHDASAPTGNVQTFRFTDTLILRGFLRDGEPWFVAGDVAGALDYSEAKDMTRNLDDDEKGRQIVPTLGGDQEMTVINESGLYSAILKSRKPEAKAFKKWVTSEVLPSIRKTGSYTAPTAQPTPKPKQPRISQPGPVKELLLIGKEMAKLKGINPHLVMAYTLDAIEQVTDLPASMLARALPAVAPAEVASLNPTAIGKQLGGLKAHAVNQMLLKAGLQRQDGSGWQLTEAGTAFGEMKPFHRNGHSGYNLLWLPRVVQLLQNINTQPAH
jgi:prophage antirepressor-like protein